MLLVQGLASSTLYDTKDPLAPANRRISIIVMNREAEVRSLRRPLAAAKADGEERDEAEAEAKPRPPAARSRSGWPTTASTTYCF